MKKHTRRRKYRLNSLRLANWDYSNNGAYFITICTQNRAHIFGRIINKQLENTEASQICQQCWQDLPHHYPNCFLDEFIIMPDHIHAIILLHNNVRAGLKPAPTTLNPAPTTLNPAPTTLKPAPTTLKPAPTTLKPAPTKLNSAPTKLNPAPTTLNPAPTKLNSAQTPLKSEQPPINNTELTSTPLSEIIRAFKTFSARKINSFRNTTGQRLWQRGYYDHIIRNNTDLLRIRKYIKNNPAKWHQN